jgi:hypothetical protein
MKGELAAMPNTIELVQGFSDSQVVEVMKELFNTVYTNVPYEQVMNNSKGVADVGQLVSLDEDTMQQELSATDSTRFGRLVLDEYARDPQLAVLIEQAWEKVQSSDDLIVDPLLALGLVVNLTLFMATTEVTLERGPGGKTHWKFIKKAARPGLVSSILNPLAKVFKLGAGQT